MRLTPPQVAADLMEAWPAAPSSVSTRSSPGLHAPCAPPRCPGKDRPGTTRRRRQRVDCRQPAGAGSVADLRRLPRGDRLPPAEEPRGRPAMPRLPMSSVPGWAWAAAGSAISCLLAVDLLASRGAHGGCHGRCCSAPQLASPPGACGRAGWWPTGCNATHRGPRAGSAARQGVAVPCRFRCSHIFRLPYSDSGWRRPRASGS